MMTNLTGYFRLNNWVPAMPCSRLRRSSAMMKTF
jgi:hypothetical protein